MGSVTFCTASGVTPGATSRSTSPFGVTSITAISVTIKSTTRMPVSGSVQFFMIFGPPSLVVCSMAMITRFGARHQIHRAAHALQHFPGDGPVGERALFVHLQRAEHGHVDVPAANHRE